MTERLPQIKPHLITLLLCIFLFNSILFLPYTNDDAYITMRYAQNAAAGEGPVYHVGERVEGYSNPSWLALLTVAAWLGLNLVGTAKVLGIAAALAVLLLALGILLRLTDTPSRAAYAGLLPLATSAPLACYAVSGLETVLYAALLTAIVYCWLIPGPSAWWALVACAVAAAFTRPEGLVVLVAVVAWRGLRLLEMPPPARRAYVISLPLLALLVGWFLVIRYAYFGSWLPNTFYAKPPGAFGAMSLLSPLTYVRGYLVETGAWLWLGLLGWKVIVPRWRSAALAVLLILGVQTALVVHARGDWMALHRFLLPVTPLLVTFGYASLLRTTLPRSVVGAILALLAVQNGIQIAQVRESFLQGLYPYNVMAGRPQEQAGKWLSREFPSTTTVATKRIGGVGYYSGMRIVDVLGLVDRPIAMIRHGSDQRGAAEWDLIAREVFRRRPDIIMLAAMKRWDDIPVDRPAPDVGHNLLDVDTALHGGLAEHGYQFVCRIPQGGTGEFIVYVRKGWPVTPGSLPTGLPSTCISARAAPAASSG